MAQEQRTWNLSDLDLLEPDEVTDDDSPRCSISGLPLLPVQLRLRRARKRMALWFLLCALLLCVSETLSQHLYHVGWHRLTLSLFCNLLILVLFIQLSMILIISCYNLTTRIRF